MKKVTLALCLSASAAHASNISDSNQAIVDRLATESGNVSNRLAIGQSFVTTAVQAAGQPSLISADAYREALISDALQDSYNSAMADFMNADFYSAQEHLQEMVEIAGVNLDRSVDNFVEASAVIEVVTRINNQAQQVSNIVEAEALQDYAVAQGADQGITDAQQDNYNEALAEVSTAAREFATYKAASVDSHMIEHMNQFADQYGADMNYAQTSILPTGYIQTAYFDPTGGLINTLAHGNYFTPAYSDESVYADQEYR